MVVALSLAAALCFATASVLQHQAASAAPRGRAGGIGLLARLAVRPRWVLGVLFDIGGYLLQVVALDRGALALVQPLLAAGLLFALLFNTSHHGRGMRKRDWLTAGLSAAGLAVFVIAGAPRGVHQRPDDPAWAAFTAATALLVAIALVLSQRRRPAARAALLAGGAGITYALSAALTKQSVTELHLGVGHLLSTSYPYALALAGLGGMVLTQTAFQSGPLAASLPTLTLSEPVFAAVAGAVLFGERLRGGAAGVVAMAGAFVGGCAVLLLTRSPSAQPLLHTG